MDNNKIADEGLRALLVNYSNFPCLLNLSLCGNSITFEGINDINDYEIQFPKLREINLSFN